VGYGVEAYGVSGSNDASPRVQSAIDSRIMHALWYRQLSAVGPTRATYWLIHFRQFGIVFKSRSDCIATYYTVICFMTHDCSRKLWKQTWIVPVQEIL